MEYSYPTLHIDNHFSAMSGEVMGHILTTSVSYDEWYAYNFHSSRSTKEGETRRDPLTYFRLIEVCLFLFFSVFISLCTLFVVDVRPFVRLSYMYITGRYREHGYN